MPFYSVPPKHCFLVLLADVERPGLVGSFEAISVWAHMGYVDERTGRLVFRNYQERSRATYGVAEYEKGVWRWWGRDEAVEVGGRE